MKTTLIFVLLLALGGGAALSRPSEAHFKSYYTAQLQNQPGGSNAVADWLLDTKAKMELKDLQYTHRVVYATVEKEGKVVYLGLFSRWFRVGK